MKNKYTLIADDYEPLFLDDERNVLTADEILNLLNDRDKFKKALMLLAGALTEADPSLTRVEMVKIAQEALK